MRAYTHRGWAHRQWVSTTFLTRKNGHTFFLCACAPDGVRTSCLWISSHPVTPDNSWPWWNFYRMLLGRFPVAVGSLTCAHLQHMGPQFCPLIRRTRHWDHHPENSDRGEKVPRQHINRALLLLLWCRRGITLSCYGIHGGCSSVGLVLCNLNPKTLGSIPR